MSSNDRCPINFTIQEDCCVTPELTANIIRSDTITNSNIVATKDLHSTEQFVNSVLLDDAYITTSQPNLPTTSHVATGITGATMAPKSTDIAGMVVITGTAVSNDRVVITYHTPYPGGSVPIVTLTPALPSAGINIGTTGVSVNSTNTQITIQFINNATVTVGADPSFFYHVVCPVSA